jgi:hypothetical protein
MTGDHPPMPKKLRQTLCALNFLLFVASLTAWAQGPKIEYFYNPRVELSWAQGQLYFEGGSCLKIPFLPVVLGKFQRAPMGTGNYEKDVSVDAPLVFIGDGIFKEGERNCYRGRRQDYATGDIDVAGKAVIFCADFPDKSDEKLGADFPLERRIAEAARRHAVAALVFSWVQDYPFFVVRYSRASEIPDIPAVSISRTSVHDLFLGDLDIDDASLTKTWKESGVPPQAAELSARIRLRMEGAFAKAERNRFIFRARPAEISIEDLERIARVNEQALEFLMGLFQDDSELKWKKSLVVYFHDYDSKVFYTHHWGRGLSSEEGSFMIDSGGIPDKGLAAHENTHTLIGQNWGDSTSFMAEGLGRYAEAQATEKDMNHLKVIEFLKSGKLFPLKEMLTFWIGTGGLKTEVGYPASGSFVDFLIQSYNLRTLREAYRLEGRSASEKEKDDTWRRVYQKPIQDLEKEWLDCLKKKFKVDDKLVADHLKKSAVPRPVVAIDPKILESLTGRYAVSGGMVLTVSTENSRLFLEVPNMAKMELTPQAELVFAVQGLDATATFVRGGTGQVEQMIFHTPAGDMPAEKIEDR